MTEAVHTPRVFSGIQPTGNLTLGNYLGAVKRFVEMQDNGIETIYCMVDLHAITTWQDPADLKRATRELAAGFIASGLDPAKSILFNQSQVSAHAELGWIFNCVSRMGWLNRMTQFKDKAGKNREAASVGLFAYPNLMAADILVYHATEVPVGEDQKQHLELTRDIAEKFNHDYKVNWFPIPEPVIKGAATRVMSLRDGTKKIRKAKTDPDPLPDNLQELENRPEARNLVNIYAGLSGDSPEKVIAEHAGQQFGQFKPDLADLAVAKLAPISTEMARLMDDPAEIDRLLGQGAGRAAAIANPILERTLDILGMVRSREV